MKNNWLINSNNTYPHMIAHQKSEVGGKHESAINPRGQLVFKDMPFNLFLAGELRKQHIQSNRKKQRQETSHSRLSVVRREIGKRRSVFKSVKIYIIMHHLNKKDYNNVFVANQYNHGMYGVFFSIMLRIQDVRY